MNPEDLPKGAGSGEMPDLAGRMPANKPGIYEHKAAGKRLIVMPDAQSTAQQDALVRMGWVWVADPPSRQEVLKQQQKQAAKDAEAEKKGMLPETPITPGTQEVIHNGTATPDPQVAIDAANARAQAAEQQLAEMQQAELERVQAAKDADKVEKTKEEKKEN